jgi:hypothetical protein
MPWPLRYRSAAEPWKDAQFGDCWYYPDWDSQDAPYPAVRKMFLEHQASRQYLDQWADKRPPIVIWLPPGFGFSPDEKYRGGHRGENPEREGWTVSGVLEDGTLVVQPSVNIVGVYHGWIQDAQLSEDVEGRRFLNAEGR